MSLSLYGKCPRKIINAFRVTNSALGILQWIITCRFHVHFYRPWQFIHKHNIALLCISYCYIIHIYISHSRILKSSLILDLWYVFVVVTSIIKGESVIWDSEREREREWKREREWDRERVVIFNTYDGVHLYL